MKAMVLASCALVFLLLSGFPLPAQSGDWMRSFPVKTKDMGTPVDNPHFVLEPTKQLHFQDGTSKLTRTVVRITGGRDRPSIAEVEDRKERDGKLLEVDREYYSMDKLLGDVYCFGREVNNYEAGEGVSHEGSWASGVGGASFGLVMPAEPKVGDKFYEAVGPDSIESRSEVVGINDKVKTQVATYEHCVHIKEIGPGKKGRTDNKWYAPGIGMVKVNDLILVKIQEIEIQPVDSDDK